MPAATGREPNRQGEILGTRSFATTRAGYRAMLAWMRGFGERAKDRGGQVEALRVTRTTAVTCRRATMQTLRTTITAAP